MNTKRQKSLTKKSRAVDLVGCFGALLLDARDPAGQFWIFSYYVCFLSKYESCRGTTRSDDVDGRDGIALDGFKSLGDLGPT